MPALLTIRNLHLTLPGTRRGLFHRTPAISILRGVDLDVPVGGSTGLVGESGSGKSTLSRTILGLIPATSGSIHLTGSGELVGRNDPAWIPIRRRIQMVFQNPRSALDPRWRIVDTVAEPLRIVGMAKRDALCKAEKILSEMGLGPEEFQRYPHEFSGGQRQRIVIARSLMLEPELLVADEPVSALDVSIQAQILKLLDELRRKRNMALLFVSHDLGVVRAITENVAVLYAGQVMESGPTEDVFQQPLHPYTRELLAAAPRLEASESSPAPLDDLFDIPQQGCSFCPRCPSATTDCQQEIAIREIAPGRTVRCIKVKQ